MAETDLSAQYEVASTSINIVALRSILVPITSYLSPSFLSMVCSRFRLKAPPTPSLCARSSLECHKLHDTLQALIDLTVLSTPCLKPAFLQTLFHGLDVFFE